MEKRAGVGQRIRLAIGVGFALVLLVGGVSVLLAWAIAQGVEEGRHRGLMRGEYSVVDEPGRPRPRHQHRQTLQSVASEEPQPERASSTRGATRRGGPS